VNKITVNKGVIDDKIPNSFKKCKRISQLLKSKNLTL